MDVGLFMVFPANLLAPDLVAKLKSVTPHTSLSITILFYTRMIVRLLFISWK